MSIACLGGDKPRELLITCIVRARFCELVAAECALKDRQDELFLMGMFSALDAILDCSMEAILEEIPLAPDLKLALLGEYGSLRNVLDFAIGYERGDWNLFEYMRSQIGLTEERLGRIQIDAIQMAENVLRVDETDETPLPA